MKLEPDWTRTLLMIGDQHWTAPTVTTSIHLNANERAQKYQNRVLARGTPAGVFNIGDITEQGRPEEYANAIPWWNAWPNPKTICPGNHDIMDGSAGAGVLSDWVGHFGDPTQVLETPYFRVVSTLWTKDVTGATFGMNSANVVSTLTPLIQGNGARKPTILAFHFAVRGQWDVTTPFSNGVTAVAMDNIAQLIDACPNLQGVITGHTHTWPSWMQNAFNTGAGVPEIAGSQAEGPLSLNSATQGAIKGKVGNRRVWSFNVGATTYLGGAGDIRSPLYAHFLTFSDIGMEYRHFDVERDAWRHRFPTATYPLVEQYRYT